MTPRHAYDLAVRSSRLDTAMLLMSADHVARRLRELAADAEQSDEHLAARLKGLAAQLDAGGGRLGRPEQTVAHEMLTSFAAGLDAVVAVRALPDRAGGLRGGAA